MSEQKGKKKRSLALLKQFSIHTCESVDSNLVKNTPEKRQLGELGENDTYAFGFVPVYQIGEDDRYVVSGGNTSHLVKFQLAERALNQGLLGRLKSQKLREMVKKYKSQNDNKAVPKDIMVTYRKDSSTAAEQELIKAKKFGYRDTEIRVLIVKDDVYKNYVLIENFLSSKALKDLVYDYLAEAGLSGLAPMFTGKGSIKCLTAIQSEPDTLEEVLVPIKGEAGKSSPCQLGTKATLMNKDNQAFAEFRKADTYNNSLVNDNIDEGKDVIGLELVLEKYNFFLDDNGLVRSVTYDDSSDKANAAEVDKEGNIKGEGSRDLGVEVSTTAYGLCGIANLVHMLSSL